MIGGELKGKKMLKMAEANRIDVLESAFIMCTTLKDTFCLTQQLLIFNSPVPLLPNAGELPKF